MVLGWLAWVTVFAWGLKGGVVWVVGGWVTGNACVQNDLQKTTSSQGLSRACGELIMTESPALKSNQPGSDKDVPYHPVYSFW